MSLAEFESSQLLLSSLPYPSMPSFCLTHAVRKTRGVDVPHRKLWSL